jgi:ubiquinone/menaquinone biosynthesis C-methylase UbiE
MEREYRNFDQEAESWDQRPQRVRLAQDVADAVLREVGDISVFNVLDFGCGTGLLTLLFQPLVHSITGVDSSSGMLQVLNRKIANLKLTNIHTVLCDLEQGQTLPGKYDLIVSSMTLHHVRSIAPLLDQLYAALAPGGRICVADLDPEQGRFHSDSTGVFHCGFERTDLAQAFSQAGFVNISTQTAAHIIKPAADQQPTSFSVFLLSGSKT